MVSMMVDGGHLPSLPVQVSLKSKRRTNTVPIDKPRLGCMSRRRCKYRFFIKCSIFLALPLAGKRAGGDVEPGELAEVMRGLPHNVRRAGLLKPPRAAW